MKLAVTFLLLLLSIVSCSIAAEADGRGVRGELRGKVVEEDESGSIRNLQSDFSDEPSDTVKKMMTGMMKNKKKKDNEKFEYIFENKEGELVTVKEGCDYVAKNKKKRCAKTINGEKVSDKCAATCKKHLPNYDDFVLEGDRVYVGCDGYIFRMNIQCDIFGENDPDLCLLKSTFIGLADANGTAVVGFTTFNPFSMYEVDIDDLDPAEACIGSGVFSRKRIKNGKFAPVPMTSSDGCASVGKPDDYLFVMKGELSSDGSNDMKIEFSDDMGFTYYTKVFTQPGIYKAYYESDDTSASSERRLRELSFNGDVNAPACQFADASELNLDTCTQHEIMYNNPSWVDATDPDSDYYHFRQVYFKLVMGTDRWVANGFPDDFRYTRLSTDGPTSEVKICRSDGTLKYSGSITNEFDSHGAHVTSGAREDQNRIEAGDYIIRPECECVPRCMQHLLNAQPSIPWNDDPRFYNVYFDGDRERWQLDGFPGDFQRQPRYTPEVKICRANGFLMYEGQIINGFPWARLEPFRGLDWFEENGYALRPGDYIVRPDCECSSPSHLPPSESPSFSPSHSPSSSPSHSPSFSPSHSPSVSHTNSPSVSHTDSPSVSHTDSPSVSHTDSPSVSHTNSPSASPSSSPTTNLITYTFPVTTNRLSHGLCLKSYNGEKPIYSYEITKTSSYPYAYTEIDNFQDGVQLWGDRTYTVRETGDICQDGLFLQSTNWFFEPDSVISITVDVSNGPVTLFAFVGEPDNYYGYDGGWDLISDGFTAGDTFRHSHGDSGYYRAFHKHLGNSFVNYKFPIADYALWHAFCLLPSDSSSPPLYSIRSDDVQSRVGPRIPFTYSAVEGFTEGTPMFRDRPDVFLASGTTGNEEQCEGGLLLHTDIDVGYFEGAEIEISIDVSNGPVTLYAFVVDRYYTGEWDLESEGFTKSQSIFQFTGGALDFEVFHRVISAP